VTAATVEELGEQAREGFRDRDGVRSEVQGHDVIGVVVTVYLVGGHDSDPGQLLAVLSVSPREHLRGGWRRWA
jgi:hypothetical protein